MRRIMSFIIALLLTTSPSAASYKECQAALRDMCASVKKLRGFEDSKTFKFYGFAVAGPHNKWLRKAEALRDKTQGMNVLPYAEGDVALPGDVVLWGLEKMRCATRDNNCDHEYIAYVEGLLSRMKCKQQ